MSGDRHALVPPGRHLRKYFVYPNTVPSKIFFNVGQVEYIPAARCLDMRNSFLPSPSPDCGRSGMKDPSYFFGSKYLVVFKYSYGHFAY